MKTKERKILKFYVDVETRSGHRFGTFYTAEEFHDENDYGNGNYISIDREDGSELGYFDVRYWKGYKFEDAVKEIMEIHFGENLKKYEVIE